MTDIYVGNGSFVAIYGRVAVIVMCGVPRSAGGVIVDAGNGALDLDLDIIVLYRIAVGICLAGIDYRYAFAIVGVGHREAVILVKAAGTREC